MSERQDKGQFAKGNKGGPGNPHAATVAKLRGAMLKAVTPTAIKRVMNKLIQMAEGGDLKAIELLLNRTCGKPEVTSTPTIAIQNNVSQSTGLEKALEIAHRVRGHSRSETGSQMVARLTNQNGEPIEIPAQGDSTGPSGE